MNTPAAILASALLLAVPATAAPRPALGYHVVHGWPVLPAGIILGQPAGVGVDSHGDVFVFHRASRTWVEPLTTEPLNEDTIAVFDGRTGVLKRSFGAGLFALPHGLTIDAHDNIWLTDVALNQVFKLSPQGKVLLTLGERGVAGDDNRHFNRPSDVAVAPDGGVYVSDGYRNTRMMKFAPDGTFQFQWGTPGSGPGEFNLPHAVALDDKGRVYVADRSNARVQVFDPAGHVLAQWKDPALGRPYSIAIGPHHRAVVVDGGDQPRSGPDRSGAAVVDLDGHVLARFGVFGNQDGQFRGAHDVAMDAHGAIYVVDTRGQRVQKFVANVP